MTPRILFTIILFFFLAPFGESEQPSQAAIERNPPLKDERDDGLRFSGQFSVGDLSTTVGLLIAGAGLFLNWRQLKKDALQKRAEFIVLLFNQYITDAETSAMLYKLEYGQFSYTPSFHGSNDERALDRLLSYFEKIGAIYFMGTINLSDLELVRYDFLRVFTNEQIQSYLNKLDSLTAEIGVAGGSFAKYRAACRDLTATKESSL